MSFQVKHIAWLCISLLALLLSREEGLKLGPEDHCDLEIPELPDLVICDDDFDGRATFDFTSQISAILDPLGGTVEPTVLISEQTAGLLKVTNLDSGPEYEYVCENFPFAVTDMAINAIGGFFAVSNTNFLFRIDTLNCDLIPVSPLDPLQYATALSFDPAGNLYVGGAGTSVVYRAEAGTFANFQPWHDFLTGFPSGDFVTVKGKLYIAWSVPGQGDFLYEVTVDEDFQYVTHVNRGQILSETWGLASEFGRLFGIRYNELYEISLPDLQLRTVLQHPRSDLWASDADAWWGGAGLHEAGYEITFHRTEEDAQNNFNAIEGDTFVNETNPQTIFVRVFDHANQCQELSQFELQVHEPPQILTPPVMELCTEEAYGSDFDLTQLDTAMVADTTGISITYHFSEDGAQINADLITEPITTSDSPQPIYIRAEDRATTCVSFADLDLVFRQKPTMSIYGAHSVCPDVKGVLYEARANLPVTDHDWVVLGGTIVENQGSTIRVDWGDTNAHASISLSASYGAGCHPEAVVLPVVINRRLEPAAPQGPVSVCDSDRVGLNYSVPSVPGSQYRWTVENGSIVGSDDGNSVTVNWDAAVQGKIYFEEFNPAIAQCEGFSDTLSVVIHPVLEVTPEVTLPLCNGDANGEIQLRFSQTVDDVEVIWAQGHVGSRITGLSSGIYNYSVSDMHGCLYSGSVTVGDHPSLGFAEIQVTDITCFGLSNGQVRAAGRGGVGSYSYTMSGNGIDQVNQDGIFNGLGAGTYTLTVIDENDCRWGETVTVIEPEALRLDEDNIVNEAICPGSSDGELEVTVLGGTPPYHFRWSADPSLNENRISGLSKGDYELIITDDNGCETSVTLTVNEFIPRLFVPTAFSPNGDDNNDTFEVVTGCTPTSFAMTIFNRWGNVVYYTNDVNLGWDGLQSGVPAPAALYTYVIAYAIEVNGELVSEELRGDFRLMR